MDCTASEPECKQSQCIAGGCNYVNKGNGTPCSTGTCGTFPAVSTNTCG